MVEQFSGIVKELSEEGIDVQKIKSEIENIHHLSKRVNENGIRIKKIVYVMLEHGKVTRGEISLVNVNELLHQSSEIAYQDYLSKDSAFDVKVEEYFDDNLKEIEGFPQDLSRVFFNVIHNALYAAYEKKTIQGDHPTVIIKTMENNGYVDISVRDNGKGIPEDIRDDVLTQFFTTKPPGTGAGLGLSLSYDIVVHEHKGELLIHSSTEKEKSFTEVSIKLFHRLPIGEHQHG